MKWIAPVLMFTVFAPSAFAQATQGEMHAQMDRWREYHREFHAFPPSKKMQALYFRSKDGSLTPEEQKTLEEARNDQVVLAKAGRRPVCEEYKDGRTPDVPTESGFSLARLPDCKTLSAEQLKDTKASSSSITTSLTGSTKKVDETVYRYAKDGAAYTEEAKAILDKWKAWEEQQ